MTAVWCRPVGYPRYCRLLTIGSVRHVTACRATIDATEAIEITATQPSLSLGCSACLRDAEAKRQRVPTVDLRPSVGEVGNTADVEVDNG